MTFWRRHWWTRRTLIGLAFAALVAPAAQAKPLPGPSHFVGPYADIANGYDSPGIQGEAVKSRSTVSGQVLPDFTGASVDPYLTDVASRPAEASATGPDGTIVASSADSGSARPDDRADRFVVGDGSPAPAQADDGFNVSWDGGLTIGIGALAAMLVLGLAVAALRRPRLAGP